MEKKAYDPKKLRACKLRKSNHHIDEIGQKEWDTVDCMFTRNACCEQYGVHCPLREFLILGKERFHAGGDVEVFE